MKNRTILFVMNVDTPDEEIARIAESAARDDTHLLCLLIDIAPALPMYAFVAPPYGGLNIPDNWPETVNYAHKKQKARVDEVEQILARSAASGDVMSALSTAVDAKHHVARCARVSDEAVLADNLRDDPDFQREAMSGILFHSPVGVQINASDTLQYGRILVAWDSSEAAAAAAHTALPYLKSADEVVIACIDPVMVSERDGQEPGVDLAAWLSHHGCKVTVSQVPSGGRSISDCIKDRARETGADLVVMGAYGHARMIQTVLGGTTRSMVDQRELSVLLAH